MTTITARRDPELLKARFVFMAPTSSDEAREVAAAYMLQYGDHLDVARAEQWLERPPGVSRKMLRSAAVAGVALAAIVGLAVPAFAQDCQSQERLYAHLHDQYGEAPVGFGTHSSGSVMSFWGNAGSGSWSIVETDPNSGIACLVAVGSDFRIAEYLLGEAM